MDNRPIGFFDSGLGGLTCVMQFIKTFPHEKIIYFGDTARTPYGSKAVSTIERFSFEIADFLMSKDVKMLVIACNTITSTCLDALRKKYTHIPIIGIIDPAAKKVAETCTKDNRIGIIGTKVTIEHKSYIKSIHSYCKDLKLYDKACPIFVPLIEEGIIDNDIMNLSIKHYLDDFTEKNKLDTLVLGCTHYPLIIENIRRLYPQMHIINPSEEIVSSIGNTLLSMDILSAQTDLENEFYASDLSENFIEMIRTISKNSLIGFKSFEME